MSKITTTTKIQKTISSIAKDVKNNPYIATVRGEPVLIMLPYFDKSDDIIEDYMEEYEMFKNKKKLEKELEKSTNSGISDFEI